MQQQFGEEEHCEQSSQDEIHGWREEGQNLHMLIQQVLYTFLGEEGQDIHVLMQRLLRRIFHSPRIIVLLTTIFGALLAALRQSGLLWLFLMSSIALRFSLNTEGA